MRISSFPEVGVVNIIFLSTVIYMTKANVWPQTHGNQHNTRESIVTAPFNTSDGLGFEVYINEESSVGSNNVGNSGYSAKYSLYNAISPFDPDMPYSRVTNLIFSDTNTSVVFYGGKAVGRAYVENSWWMSASPFYTMDINNPSPPRSSHVVTRNGAAYHAHGNSIWISNMSQELKSSSEVTLGGIESCNVDFNDELKSMCEWIVSVWLDEAYFYASTSSGSVIRFSINDRKDSSIWLSDANVNSSISHTAALVYDDLIFMPISGMLLKFHSYNFDEREIYKVTDGILITSPQLLGIAEDGAPYILLVDDGWPSAMYIVNGFTGDIITYQEFIIGDLRAKILPGVQPVVSNFSFVLTVGAPTDWTVPIGYYYQICLADKVTFEKCFAGLGGVSLGVAMYKFDHVGRTIEIVWSNEFVSCPASSGTVSAPDDFKQRVFYCIGSALEIPGVNGMTTLEAIDWNSGKRLFQYQLGRHSLIAPAISETVIGPDGSIYYGAFGGIGRIATMPSFAADTNQQDWMSQNSLLLVIIIISTLLICLAACVIRGYIEDWWNIRIAQKEQKTYEIELHSRDVSVLSDAKFGIGDISLNNSGAMKGIRERSCEVKWGKREVSAQIMSGHLRQETIWSEYYEGQIETFFRPVSATSNLSLTGSLFRDESHDNAGGKMMVESPDTANTITPESAGNREALKSFNLLNRSSKEDLEVTRSHSLPNVLPAIASNSIPVAQKQAKAAVRRDSRWFSLKTHVRGLSQQVSSVNVFKLHNQLSWDDIEISTKDGSQMVLNSMTGCICSGEMWAIMGPSGCGKTTLLNVLAGRTNTMTHLENYRGRVAINNVHVNAAMRIRLTAYVLQEDVFFAELTVREVLMFAAKLKLPVDEHKLIDNEDSTNLGIVDGIMEDLVLDKVADVRVGDTLRKGISGGEKKRLAIGVELVTQPSIIFLDEPTSGLDSVATFKVCKILRGLCDSNCMVMATIHQPSHYTFELFDHVYLMRTGQCVFAEQRVELAAVFSVQGHKIPPTVNPADFTLDILQKLKSSDFKRMVNFAKKRNKRKWRRIKEEIKSVENFAPAVIQSLREFESGKLHSTWDQTKNLLSRGWKRRLRARGPSLAIIIQPLIIFLFQGILALETGKENRIEALNTNSFGDTVISVAEVCSVAGDMCPIESIPNMTVAVTNRNYYTVYALYTIILLMISINAANSTILTIPTETPIRTREIQSNLYTALPYVLSKVIIELPVTTIFFILGFSLLYFMVPFYGSFVNLAGVVWIHSWTSTSLAWLISTVTKDPNSALQLSNLFFAPQILFSGLMVQVRDIPSSLRWLNYLCYLKYSLNLCIIIELGNDPLAKDYLDNNLIREDLWLSYVCILGCIFLFCIFCTIYFMNRRNLGHSHDLGASTEVLHDEGHGLPRFTLRKDKGIPSKLVEGISGLDLDMECSSTDPGPNSPKEDDESVTTVTVRKLSGEVREIKDEYRHITA